MGWQGSQVRWHGLELCGGLVIGKRGVLPWFTLLLVFGAAQLHANDLPPAPTNSGPDPDRPILLSSNKMQSWTEGNLEIILLRQAAVIEQGLVRIHAKDAVAWIGPRSSQANQPVPVMIFAEGDVVVERDGMTQKLPKGLFDLATSSEIRLKSMQRGAQSGADDPFYRRALAERELLLQPPKPKAARNDPKPDAQVKQAQSTEPAPSNGFGRPTRRQRTVDVLPQQPQPPGSPPAPGTDPTAPPNRQRRIQIAPMGAAGYQTDSFQQGDEQVTVILSPVTVFVEDLEGSGLVDIATDRAVIWSKKEAGQQFLSGLKDGMATKEHVEIYLEGHVAIRRAEVRGPHAYVTQILLAESAYYDVAKNVALLTNGEVVTTQPQIPESIHLRGREIRQVAQNRFEATDVQIFSSRLPSDPDLVFHATDATFEQRFVPATGLLGRPVFDPKTGQPKMTEQLWTTAHNVTAEARDVPFFYWPYMQGDLKEPFGPLQNVSFKSDRVFGTGLLVDWDVFQLLGATRPPNTHWALETDYLSRRGPMLGTDFHTKGSDLFDIPGAYQTLVRARGVYDQADTDILGGGRNPPILEPWRGRVLINHRQELGEDWTFLGQFAYLSDRNFLEQYFKREFENDPNQETYAYLKYQVDNWAATIEAQPHLRPWVTETAWLPKASGYWLGQPIFDKFTYYVRGSVGYAQFRPSTDVPPFYPSVPVPDEFAIIRPLPPVSDFPHSGNVNTGRLDVWQELDLPLQLGPFKFVPYGIFDTTFYTETLTDNDVVRLYGGGGARASIPFTRIYPDVHSALFNLDGMAHKISFVADYRFVRSNVDFRELPELDRLNDDATDQSMRDLRLYRQMTFQKGTTQYALATSPLYDPQLYAIRSGLETNVDTLDDLQVLRLGIDQRFQTKRGFPGREHTVDWLTFDVSASIFPESDLENFGHAIGLLQYDAIWQVGDRTTVVSDGWVDPWNLGARVFNIGLYVDRPDRLQYFLGFRLIEPVGSEAITASTRYRFSQKYSIMLSSTYDFGERQSLGNTFVVTRTGTDLEISLGFTYDALTQNFGFVFNILPALASQGRGPGRGMAFAGSGGLLGH